MSNILKTIGTDIVRVIEAPFKYAEKVEEILATTIKDEPALKSVVVTLVSKVEGLIADGSLDVATKGLSVTDDAKTLADLQAFGAWFAASFVPVVESVYSEVVTDLK